MAKNIVNIGDVVTGDEARLIRELRELGADDRPRILRLARAVAMGEITLSDRDAGEMTRERLRMLTDSLDGAVLA